MIIQCMKIIGVTGGIGSGKTTVCKLLEIMGIPVYYADLEARRLTDTDPLVHQSVRRLLGNEVYVNGALDRKRVGEMVFSNPELLSKLNAIIHPAVAAHFKKWLDERLRFPLVAKESAILFESGAYTTVNHVMTVTAPVQLRIQRVMKRDGLSEAQIISRMSNQWTDEKKIEMSQFVVHADEAQLVIPQVINLVQEITLSHGF